MLHLLATDAWTTSARTLFLVFLALLLVSLAAMQVRGRNQGQFGPLGVASTVVLSPWLSPLLSPLLPLLLASRSLGRRLGCCFVALAIAFVVAALGVRHHAVVVAVGAFVGVGASPRSARVHPDLATSP
jgi:predicted membrane metal-binding protein